MQYYSAYSEYRKAWEQAYQRTPAIPLNLDLELSSICNLRCPFCLITDKKYKRKTKNYPYFFNFHYAQDIISQASAIGIPALKFNWIGEPTLHPDFNLIMAEARMKDFHDLIVNTNGNYRKEKNEGLIFATKVIYSIDSLNPLTYPKIRCQGNLNHVILNIKDLLKRGHRDVCLRKTITKENQNEDFERDVKRIFGNKIKTSEHYVFDRKLQKSCNRDNKKIAIKLDRVYCGYPSQRLIIDTNLDVYPCCVDYRRTMKLGNIKKDSLIKIWYSDKLNDIREQLMKGRTYVSKSCQDCRSWMAYNHKYRRMVMK